MSDKSVHRLIYSSCLLLLILPPRQQNAQQQLNLPCATTSPSPDEMKMDERCMLVFKNFSSPKGMIGNVTGRVLSCRRTFGSTRINIRNEQGDIEKFIISHPGSNDPTRWFLVNCAPFQKTHWDLIEGKSHFKLPNIGDIPVQIWLFKAGENPIINWGLSLSETFPPQNHP